MNTFAQKDIVFSKEVLKISALDLVTKAIDEAKVEFARLGYEFGLHFFTFRHDDYISNRFSMCLFSHEANRKSLTVTALEDDIAEAIAWVITNNPHLQFEDNHPAGYSGDDFVYGRITAQMNFKVKELI